MTREGRTTGNTDCTRLDAYKRNVEVVESNSRRGSVSAHGTIGYCAAETVTGRVALRGLNVPKPNGGIMLDTTEQEKDRLHGGEQRDDQRSQSPQGQTPQGQMKTEGQPSEAKSSAEREEGQGAEIHSLERRRSGARGTAAMDPQTRKEVARKGGLAVSRNRQHMSEIGRKGGQSVSKNREHMAKIGRKGGAASRGGSGPGEQG